MLSIRCEELILAPTQSARARTTIDRYRYLKDLDCLFALAIAQLLTAFQHDKVSCLSDDVETKTVHKIARDRSCDSLSLVRLQNVAGAEHWIKIAQSCILRELDGHATCLTVLR